MEDEWLTDLFGTQVE